MLSTTSVIRSGNGMMRQLDGALPSRLRRLQRSDAVCMFER